MISAFLHGKLSREQENMEDLLTSCVFDAILSERSGHGLARWFSYAEPIFGPAHALPSSFELVEVNFWPWLTTGVSGAEPDVVLKIQDNQGAPHRILVEAKFRSGKSSEGNAVVMHPTDQLAREWHNLLADLEPAESPHLIYLTAGFGAPIAEIAAAEKEFSEKLPDLARAFPFSCSWLSWRHLIPAFQDDAHRPLRQLAQLMDKLGLSFFSGIHPLECPNRNAWRFASPTIAFDYPTFPSPSPWSFRNDVARN